MKKSFEIKGPLVTFPVIRQAMKAVKTHTFKHLQRFSTQAVELLGPVLAKNLKFCERLPC